MISGSLGDLSVDGGYVSFSSGLSGGGGGLSSGSSGNLCIKTGDDSLGGNEISISNGLFNIGLNLEVLFGCDECDSRIPSRLFGS